MTDSKLDIVFVDDDSSLLRAWTELLSRAGHCVRAASSFEEGRRQLTERVPDLLITDIRLGGFNGLQLVFRARALDPDLPVIVVTGFPDPVLRREATALGAVYLEKPLGGTELLDAVTRLLEGLQRTPPNH